LCKEGVVEFVAAELLAVSLAMLVLEVEEGDE
jgi:hypothetical protein